MNYHFKQVDECNMCGASNRKFTILGKRLNTSQGFKPYKKLGITTTVVQCTKCGLVFSNPMPVPDNIQDHYGVPTNDYWDEDYLQQSTSINGENKEFWESKIGHIYEGFTSLDIGAGLGTDMMKMQALGIDVFGIEPSETFHKKALELTGLPGEKLLMNTIEDAEFDEEFFDYINFGVVLEHLYDPSTALAKAVKWLKPGGRIHVEVPSSNWLIGKLINLSYKIRGMDYVGNLSPMHKPYHLFEFSLNSFKMNGRINNYRVVSHSYFVCKTFLPSIFDTILKPFMKWTKTGMELDVWLEKPQ